ncbi:MAG: alkaline phosphatase D family protein [Rhodothermales bacterium]
MLTVCLVALVWTGCREAAPGARLALMETVPPAGFVWSGALTPTSIRIVAGLWSSGPVRLVVRPDADTLATARSEPFTVADGGRVVTAHVEGLTPGVRYAYAFESGEETLREGRFRTPEDGPFSFDVAIGGCSLTGSDQPVYDVIRESEPLFFLHVGDMFYEDIAVNSAGFYRRAFGRVLRSPRQAALYRSTPIVYVWDDHDFGPNNSDRIAPGQEAARETYDALVPHYPLPGGPIYQAFSVGRVRFIVTDLRSPRDPVDFGEPGGRTTMGAEQKAWFKRQLLDANGRYPVIVWVSTVPWIAPPSPRSDTWGGFPQERREIADFLKDNGVEGLVIVAGDAHMVAMDDGTNSDYASGGGAPIPVIQAAPLDQTGSTKGGPYSEGEYPNPSVLPPHPGQWVEMAVTDDGGLEVCVEWTGYRTDAGSTDTETLVTWGRCFEASIPPPPLFRDLADSTATALDTLVLAPPPPTVTLTSGTAD